MFSNDEITKEIQQVRDASQDLLFLDDKKNSLVLRALANNLRSSSRLIVSENEKDLALMDKKDPNYDRLLLSVARIEAIARDVEAIASLASPAGRILDEFHRPNGLHVQKKAVPLGVVAVIYESRPNVTVDVFALCFKSGNACILKGGKEARHSNVILVRIINDVLRDFGLNNHLVWLLPSDREAMMVVLNAVGLVDVCIPRGGQALIDFVRKHAKIPVIETGAGIVHTYFDASGDLEKGGHIIDNAKTRRVSVCNALDCLVIHASRLADLPALTKTLAIKSVEIFADEASYDALLPVYPKSLLHRAKPADFGREFLSRKLAIKTVASSQEAISHIRQYTSGHSEAIIAEDETVVSAFLNRIDAAVVYVNASTAFTDGGEFGMGAEIGISTQKLHARGPMALEALTSYKWVVRGDGQVRG